MYDQLLDRFGEAPSPATRRPVADALLGRGRIVWGRGAEDDALAAFEEVIRRFDDDPEMATRVERARRNRHRLLEQLGLDEDEPG